MSDGQRTLTVRIIGDGKSGARAISGVATQTESFGRKVAKVVGIIGGLSIATRAGGAILKLGMDYERSLNILQQAGHATDKQMQQVQKTAMDLGSDLELPATSAADAANAMLELVKGGLSVDKAMRAAKGTLQLAAAAQIDGATAAQIQSSALNQFGLKGSAAAHIADLLANAANAASGEATDMALAFSYVGPVAKSFGISADDTATAVALLAKNGILANKAGTGLRGILAALANPSAKAATGLKNLSIRAFDSKGNFVGLRSITEQLAKAQKRMTKEQFAANSVMAFGREPLAALNALASSGAKKWDNMAGAVKREGGAADAAKARNKGLKGALDGLQSQLETVALKIYKRVSPALEDVVRKTSGAIDSFHGFNFDAIAQSLNNFDGHKFGTMLAKKLGQAFDAVIGLASTLADKLGKMFAKVDWVGLGLELGKAAVPLLVGLAMGILNFDLAGLLKGLAKHWQDVLLAVLAIVFMPAKWVEKIAMMLRKIPFAGKFLAWLIEAISKVGKKALGWVKKAIWDNGIMKAWSEVMRNGGVSIVTKFDMMIVRLYIAIVKWGLKLGERLTMAVSKMIYTATKWLLSHGPVQFLNGMRKIHEAIAGFVKGAGKWLLGAGKDVVMGLVNGIKNGAHLVVDAAKSLADHLPKWVKKVLHIKSPSRVFMEIGGFVTKGFAKGIQDGASGVVDAVKGMVDKVKQAVEDKKLPKSIGNALIAGMKAQTDHLKNIAKRREGIVSRLEKARDRLADIVSEKASLAATTASNAVSFGSIMNVAPDTDRISAAQQAKDDAQAEVDRLNGDESASASDLAAAKRKLADATANLNSVESQEAMTGENISRKLGDRLAALQSFNNNINLLRQRGLNETTLQEIIAAGADSGAAMAAALTTATDAQLSTLNTTEGSIVTLAGQLGDTTASAMYDSGIQAAQGVVNGIESKLDDIGKAVRKIARRIVRELKKALKIKSPSRVMAGVARFIPDGVVKGIHDRAHKVDAAMRGLVKPGLLDTSGSVGFQASGKALDGGRIAPTQVGSGGNIQVDITVQGSVIRERDLVKSVQQGIADLQRRAGRPVIATG